MKFLILIILTFQIQTAYTQFDFAPDTSKKPLFQEFHHKIKELDDVFDFQLRFWKHEGMVYPAKRRLFTLTQNNSKWNCKSYLITLQINGDYNIKMHQNLKLNCDSAWTYFLKNNPIEEISVKGYGQQKTKMIIADGTLYSLELLNPNQYKRIEYYAPLIYAKEYTHIPELQQFVNILKYIEEIRNN